jgi:hypothetical protein
MGKNINVIVAKHERDDYLAVCLHYLNIANKSRRYNVDVYIVDDRGRRNNLCLENIDIHTLYLPILDKHFNKAKLLNYGLETMNSGFDWLSIIDVDMIYHTRFFETIDTYMTNRAYIICSGMYLDPKQTEEYKNLLIKQPYYSNGTYPGASQISMSKQVYELFQKIYGEKLYCEDFIGWGGEDSDVSLRALDLKTLGLIDRIKIKDMWMHMNHDKREENSEFNYLLFEKRRTINRELLRRWKLENPDTNM